MKKIIFALSFLFTSLLLIAQENYLEMGFHLNFQNISQKGNSGVYYTDSENVQNPLNIIGKEHPGPGISGFIQSVFAYNRFILGFGLEFGTKHLLMDIEAVGYLGFMTERSISIDRFAIGVPFEAGFLVLKSNKKPTRLITSFGLLNDFSLTLKTEGAIPSLEPFLASYAQNKSYNVLPFFKIRLRGKKMGLSYTVSFKRSDFGTAKINFVDYNVALTFNN